MDTWEYLKILQKDIHSAAFATTGDDGHRKFVSLISCLQEKTAYF